MVPAIVIAAYSRPNALARLLWFLQNAKYDYNNNIPLIISLDGNAHSDVIKLAQCFEWKYGTKRIIQHKEQLGLRNHILTCGDLTEEYGAIILLEDDLIVSPYFYDYATNALQYYKSDHNVAGISLYSYRNNEFADNAPFIPITNGYDTYFMQVPSSWGQLWTREQWSSFRLCYPNIQLNDDSKLPGAVMSWPETSWKKYFFKYMVDNNKYFIYPYVSYTSNWGDAGTHFAELNAFARVPICCCKKVLYKFPSITDTNVIYDAFMEISPDFFTRNGALVDSDFIVDLYGTKDLNAYPQAMTITTKDCVNSCFDYGLDIMPF